MSFATETGNEVIATDTYEASSPLGILISPDQFFASTLEEAIIRDGLVKPTLLMVDSIESAKLVLGASPVGFVMVDSRADPERAMSQLTLLRTFAPAVTLLYGVGAEVEMTPSLLRQAFGLGAMDVLSGPPWRQNLVGHAIQRAFCQTTAALAEWRDKVDSCQYVHEPYDFKPGRSLLAEVGHEMRSPLGTIIGFAESIEHESVGPLSDESDKYRDYARNIRASGEHLLALFNDLLEIGSAAARSMREREHLDVEGVLTNAALMIIAAAAEKGVSVSVEPEIPSVLVLGSNRLVQQALLNLLQNSIKFTPPGGNITISASADGQLHLSVADSGIGIVRNSLQRLREDPEHIGLESESGYGLGLPFVARVAAAHGGELDIESVLGEGTKVTLTFPMETSKAAA